MAVFFLADTHFGHKNVIKYENRPFEDAHHMDNEMTLRWNRVVTEWDHVFFLGDFALGKTEYVLKMFAGLNGRKTIVRGNHDQKYNQLSTAGWACVVHGAEIMLDGVPVYLSHYPSAHKPPHCPLLIHGHVHGKGSTEFVDGKLCVSCELWDYTPVSDEVLVHRVRKWKKQVGWDEQVKAKDADRARMYVEGRRNEVLEATPEVGRTTVAKG